MSLNRCISDTGSQLTKWIHGWHESWNLPNSCSVNSSLRTWKAVFCDEVLKHGYWVLGAKGIFWKTVEIKSQQITFPEAPLKIITEAVSNLGRRADWLTNTMLVHWLSPAEEPACYTGISTEQRSYLCSAVLHRITILWALSAKQQLKILWTSWGLLSV